MLFTYKAVDRDGKTVTGKYEAVEQRQVVAYLKAQHMTPFSIGNGLSAEGLASKLPQKKPKAKDMSIFCEQFCALIRAGVTILDALKLLLNQLTDKSLKNGVQQAIIAVNEGETLADALGRTPAFDETFISLVRAGEASGSLDKSLERMAAQYEKDAEVAAAIKKALSYPIIVLIIAVVVVVFMLIYIVPSFMNMFADIGIEMPKITLMVVAASDWLIAHWILVLLIVLVLVIAAVTFAKSATGKKFFAFLSLKIPGVNNFVIKSNSSKIARTLATLLTAGMTVIEALVILESTLSNYYYKEAIKEIRDDVLNGQPMSRKFLANDKLFPQMLSHMVSVGEDTGDITSMLNRTADYYDLEVQTATESMMSMIQPAIIIFLVGIVGVILAAVLSPMVVMYSELGDAL